MDGNFLQCDTLTASSSGVGGDRLSPMLFALYFCGSFFAVIWTLKVV